MKHLVVVAHPAEDSFTMGLTRAYAAELEKIGHSQRTHDLYRMRFDPILAASELAPPSTDHSISRDVAEAQDDLRSADALTVVYPLWWMSMPAMMKGYIDRVFSRGFAYEYRSSGLRGLLSGKKAILITVSGAPLSWLVKSGSWNAVQALQDTHIFLSCGFALLEHLHFDEVGPELSKAVADQHMARVQSCARRHFPAG
jgi:NAD(P)H dehydrogenase (quinone)